MASLAFSVGWILTIQFLIGLSIKIEVTNNYSDDVMQNAINIRCVVQKTGNCEKTDIILQLCKEDDKKLASVQGEGRIVYGHFQRPSIEAEGHIDDNDVSKSYLSVTIHPVMKEDSGRYTCSTFFLDEQGHMQSEHASDEVTIHDQTSEDLIRYLLRKISYLENLVKTQHNTTQTSISDVENSVSSLRLQQQGIYDNYKDFAENVSNKMADLMYKVDEGKNLSQVVQKLVEKESYTVAFSFKFNKRDRVIAGKRLVFSDQLLNIGNGYNHYNGVFTAPRDGLYAFHLSLRVKSDEYIIVDLQAKRKSVATLMAWDKSHNDQTSVSTIVFLNKGSTVRPRVHATKSNHVFSNNETYSFFTGFLLKLI